jgi:DNA repair protein RecO (recombination protein O)
VAGRLKLRAVVLRTVDHGEADRVVTLLALGEGTLAVFARSARVSRKRFGGGLEPFTLVTAEVTRRGGDARLARLESVTTERAFQGIRSDLGRIACAAYAVELARELTREHQAHDELFQLLVDYLGHLDEAPARPAMLRAYELAALAATGFQPRLDACARCGGPLPDEVTFAPAEGGVLCSGCAGPATADRLRLSAGGLAALRRLQAGGLAAGTAPLDAGAARESKEALTRFLEQLLGRRLQARRFLDEVGHLLGD